MDPAPAPASAPSPDRPLLPSAAGLYIVTSVGPADVRLAGDAAVSRIQDIQRGQTVDQGAQVLPPRRSTPLNVSVLVVFFLLTSLLAPIPTNAK